MSKNHPALKADLKEVCAKIEGVFSRGSLDFENLNEEFDFALGTQRYNWFLFCKTTYNIHQYFQKGGKGNVDMSGIDTKGAGDIQDLYFKKYLESKKISESMGYRYANTWKYILSNIPLALAQNPKEMKISNLIEALPFFSKLEGDKPDQIPARAKEVFTISFDKTKEEMKEYIDEMKKDYGYKQDTPKKEEESKGEAPGKNKKDLNKIETWQKMLGEIKGNDDLIGQIIDYAGSLIKTK